MKYELMLKVLTDRQKNLVVIECSLSCVDAIKSVPEKNQGTFIGHFIRIFESTVILTRKLFLSRFKDCVTT